MPFVLPATPTATTANIGPGNPAPGTQPATHCDYPFRLGPNGRPVYVEQDSPADVQACIARILVCPLGAKPNDPNFGRPWPLFQTAPLDTDTTVAAVQKLEPRADSLTILAVARNLDPSSQAVTVTAGVDALPQ